MLVVTLLMGVRAMAISNRVVEDKIVTRLVPPMIGNLFNIMLLPLPVEPDWTHLATRSMDHGNPYLFSDSLEHLTTTRTK
jgi:hypothetical protein